MDPLNPDHEGHLAWHLADEYRHSLPESTTTMLFVNLGAGDHLLVIRDVLKAVAEHGQSLSAENAHQVQRWIDSSSQHVEFQALLDRARPGGEPGAQSVS